MTTKREVKKLTRRLLEAHPNFELVGRLLVMKPVHHLVRGIFIARTRSADCFTAYRVIDYLIGEASINLCLGGKLYRKTSGLWLFSSNHVEEDFRSVFETDAAPFFQKISSLKDLETHVLETKPLNGHLAHPSIEGVRMKMALGELNAAGQFAEQVISMLMSWYDKHEHYDRKRLITAQKLLAMLQRGNREEMVEHLHAVERLHAEAHNIAHLHERTPFPLELM